MSRSSAGHSRLVLLLSLVAWLAAGCAEDPVGIPPAGSATTAVVSASPSALTTLTPTRLPSFICNVWNASSCLSFPHAINDRGEMVGGAYEMVGGCCTVQKAALWHALGLQNLDPRTATQTYSVAHDINEAGRIVGTRYLGTSWIGGIHTPLGWVNVPTTAPNWSYCYAVNPSGVALCVEYPQGTNANPIRWVLFDGSGYNVISTDPTLHLKDLDDAGTVIGSRVADASHGYRAAVVRNPDGTIVDLPTLAGTMDGEAFGFSSDGRFIAGYNLVGGQRRAVVWDNQQVFEVGNPLPGSCIATDVNRLGHATGYCYQSGSVTGWVVAGGSSYSLGVVEPNYWRTSRGQPSLNNVGQVVGNVHAFDGAVWTYPFATNDAPVAVAGGPYATPEGSTLVLDGSASSDPNGDALTWSWDFGDGPPLGSGPTPSHSYADNGSYTITLTVSDGSLTTSATTTANVSNVAPTAVLQAPSGNLPAPATFTLTLAGATDPSPVDAASLTYSFDCEGDGIFTTPSASPSQSCTLASPGSYLASGRVRDKDGASSTYSATISVVVPNAAPVANAGGPYTGGEGASILLDGSASSDPDGNALTYSWDFGDGSSAGSGATPSHAFPDNGSYTVTLTVSDGQASSSATASVTVTNVAPSGTLNVPVTAPQGPFAVSIANVVEPGAVDALSLRYRFDCAVAPTTPPSPSPSHTCTIVVPGTYTISAAVRDKDGGASTYRQRVTITNAAPVVTLLSAPVLTVSVGTSATISASFVDAGASDNPWNARIAWGTGAGPTTISNVQPGVPFGASHTFTKVGTFNVRVDVFDKYNLNGRKTVTVNVVP